MKKVVQKVYDRAGIKSQRTRNITKHVALSFLYKGGSIVCNFLLVPLTINYLDTENYGIWITLSSFIAWFSFFDVGLGNGLRNKFAEAKAKNEIELARSYVSSAYFTIGSICLAITLGFVLINWFTNWSNVFNAPQSLNSELSLLMPLLFGFFVLQLVTKLITTIYTADQHHSIQGRINFITQAGSLLIVWFLTKITESNLLLFGTVYSAFPVFLLVFLNFIAFSKKYKDFRPTFRLWKKQYVKEILGLGFLFFIVQISGIILYSTDNYIISVLFSPKEVVPYNISYKYFGILTMAFSIISTPFWSGITEAYHKNDVRWIVHSMNNLMKLVLVFCLIAVLMLFVADWFYGWWIGKVITVSLRMNLLMAIFFILTLIITPYTVFLNGTGKIRLQAIQAILVAILNIPIAFFVVRYFHTGPEGIILATILCFIPGAILSPIQYRKIISRSANGIWNK